MKELMEIKNGEAILTSEAADRIAHIERVIKDLTERYSEIKKTLLEEMERHDVIKIETEELTINRIEATTRETFDSKALRKDDPDTFDKYVRITPVKSSIRIKVR